MEIKTNEDQRIKWWKEAKFGMFIHWGLYAKLAKGEWEMAASKIPVKEYEKNAEDFNPTKFNAKDWVNIAKKTGMKYIVITAKHHDGFAMFDSKAEKFNIVDSTPFQRDPMQELAKECQKQDIKLCFYYSHVIDWHHPDSIHDAANNTWDYNLEEKAFYNYWNNLAKPQVSELLTQYGPIGVMWFDTAGGLSKKDSKEMVELVRNHQPECLINSRVSHWPDMGDYQSKGDNEIPMYGEDSREWETPMTLNKSWGYNNKDQNWKTSESVIYKMVNIVSKGGNLLLNVGPTEKGDIPDKSVEILKEVGEWLNRNEEAIYKTNRSPFLYEFDWGAITVGSNTVYLHILNKKWPQGELALYGLKNNILKGYFLADKQKCKLNISQTYEQEIDNNVLKIKLPKEAPDKHISIIALEVEGKIEVAKGFCQQSNGNVGLDLVHASVSKYKEKVAKWDFKVVDPGTFEVVMVNFKKVGSVWEDEYNNKVEVNVGDQNISCIPKVDIELEESSSCQHPYKEVHSQLGKIIIDNVGDYTLSLTCDKISDNKSYGTEIWQAEAVKLRSIKLMKC